MAEVEATIAENSETIEAPPVVEEPPAVQEITPEPKRGRGRPAGSRDKAPRTAKPRVRVEPIPQPKQAPAPARCVQYCEQLVTVIKLLHPLDVRNIVKPVWL